MARCRSRLYGDRACEYSITRAEPTPVSTPVSPPYRDGWPSWHCCNCLVGPEVAAAASVQPARKDTNQHQNGSNADGSNSALGKADAAAASSAIPCI